MCRSSARIVPLLANSISFDSGRQQRPACAQDDNSARDRVLLNVLNLNVLSA